MFLLDLPVPESPEVGRFVLLDLICPYQSRLQLDNLFYWTGPARSRITSSWTICYIGYDLPVPESPSAGRSVLLDLTCTYQSPLQLDVVFIYLFFYYYFLLLFVLFFNFIYLFEFELSVP